MSVNEQRPASFLRLTPHLGAFALALLCGALVQLPHLIEPRAFVNLDFTVHYNYAREYVASMQAGDPWPRWAFLAQEGNGEPGLLYYSPLYYMGAWLFFQITHNVWIAMQCVEILFAAILGYFAWRLCRDWDAGKWSALAIPLAVISPMLCLLHLGFNGYPWASAIGPLGALAWAVLRPRARGRYVNIPAILALAITVMTHTVTGLMGVIMVAALPLAALFEHWADRQRFTALLRSPGIWGPALTIIGGLLLSAAYLLPAFASQGLVSADVWRENYTPFNAFSLSTVTAWVFGIRWFAFQWPVSLLAVAAAAVAIYALAAKRLPEQRRWFLASAGTIVGVVIFLATELSYPLWLFDTPLRNIQFPHRLISILVPLTAVLSVLCVAQAKSRMLRGGVALAVLASLGMGTLVIGKAAILDGEVLDITEAKFGPYPGLDEYRTAYVTAQNIKGNALTFTNECAAKAVTCSEGVRHGRTMRWSLDAAQSTDVRLPAYCFPAWTLTVNGASSPARCDPATGLVQTILPPGKSQVVLSWRMLPTERIGIMLSLLTALALILLALRQRRKSA